MRRPFVLLGAALALANAAACEQVIGIEDAKLDPTFDGGTAGELCDRYCATIQANCTEADGFAQYANDLVCQAVCAALPAGEPGQTTGNNVQCRLRQAEQAGVTGEPETHCPRAGPTGAEICGDDCEGYCSVFTRYCPNAGGAIVCIEDCRANVPNQDVPYTISITQGDSVECRLYHVSAASVNPMEHCGHAAGEFPCTEPAAGGGGAGPGSGGGGTGGAGGT